MLSSSSRDAMHGLASQAKILGLENIVIGVGKDGNVDSIVLYGKPSVSSDVINRTIDELVDCGYLSDSRTLVPPEEEN